MRRVALLALVTAAGGCAPTAEGSDPAEVILELHNVQDLVSCSHDFPGTPCGSPDAPEGCNKLIERIKRALPPVWDEDRGISIVIQNGLLIVRATEHIHRAVRTQLTLERFKVAVGWPDKW